MILIPTYNLPSTFSGIPNNDTEDPDIHSKEEQGRKEETRYKGRATKELEIVPLMKPKGLAIRVNGC